MERPVLPVGPVAPVKPSLPGVPAHHDIFYLVGQTSRYSNRMHAETPEDTDHDHETKTTLQL